MIVLLRFVVQSMLGRDSDKGLDKVVLVCIFVATDTPVCTVRFVANV